MQCCSVKCLDEATIEMLETESVVDVKAAQKKEKNHRKFFNENSFVRWHTINGSRTKKWGLKINNETINKNLQC